MAHYTLYGTDHSYFTGKVRPYLRYKQIPYREKQATLLTYQRLIIPRTGVRFIPVLQTPDDEVIQDTTVIIESLESRHPTRPIHPSGAAQKLVSLLFEVYADEWFLLPAMHYRWSYLEQHRRYLMTEFGRIAGAYWPGPIKRFLGQQICRPFQGSLPYLGITERTGPAIEQWFGEFLQQFETHLAASPYLLGSRPCLGDFALAGPLYAHIWKDPYSHELITRQAPQTCDWLRRINEPEQPAGEFLADDQVPDTLLPILRHLFSEQWPVLEQTALALPGWVEAHPGRSRVSRALGWHEFQVAGVSEKRLAFSNALWMMQRPLDHYAVLSPEQRAGVDALLRECAGLQALQFRIPQRLERRDNQLVLATP